MIPADDHAEIVRAALKGRTYGFVRQPIVDLAASRAAHDELFIRFDSPVPTYQLVSAAEAAGLIHDLDFAVVSAAVDGLNRRIGPGAGFSINLSGQSIADARFQRRLFELLTFARFPPARLMFEVTESAEIEDLAAANAAIAAIRARGHQVCLDDFGAGFASLPYLQALEVDCVKIDGRYMKEACATPRAEAFFRGIARFCAELGVATVAEMIETEEQAQLARRLGVWGGQGYHFGAPKPLTALMPRSPAFA
jgi:EAL domain-containing protein (putative c-di-GMP-specific phosphodiesterase class I)